jgi:deoxyadenosine/deoxycytidine kinase
MCAIRRKENLGYSKRTVVNFLLQHLKYNNVPPRRKDIPLFLKHYSYLLKNPEVFEIFFPGIAYSSSENKQNDVIVITGKKGSGKSELAKFLAYLYHKVNPKNRVIVFSSIRDLYNDLRFAKKVNLKEVEEEESEKSKIDFSGLPDASNFANSLVIFDDTLNYPDLKVERKLNQLVNILAQNGRNFNISLIVILHQLNKGFQSSIIIRASDSLIIFPASYDRNTFNTLINHYGLNKDLVSKMYDNKGEKFILIRNSLPLYVFLGSSQEKIKL